MSFKKDDRVKVTMDRNQFNGQQGTVTLVYCDGTAFAVQFDDGGVFGYFEGELELVDAKREALIELAETLDKARLQANNINGCEGTIYQQITIPLIGVLDALVPVDAVGFDAYEFIIEDGLSVREALKAVVK